MDHMGSCPAKILGCLLFSFNFPSPIFSTFWPPPTFPASAWESWFPQKKHVPSSWKESFLSKNPFFFLEGNAGEIWIFDWKLSSLREGEGFWTPKPSFQEMGIWALSGVTDSGVSQYYDLFLRSMLVSQLSSTRPNRARGPKEGEALPARQPTWQTRPASWPPSPCHWHPRDQGQGYPDMWVPDVRGLSCTKTLSQAVVFSVLDGGNSASVTGFEASTCLLRQCFWKPQQWPLLLRKHSPFPGLPQQKIIANNSSCENQRFPAKSAFWARSVTLGRFT